MSRAAWIAWTAGVVVLLAVTVVVIAGRGGGRGSLLAANALPACLQESQLYGTAPAGYDYTPLHGADARDVLKEFDLTDPSYGHVPVAVAEGPTETNFAVMIALKRKNAADDLDDFADGGFVAAAEKGCHVVMVVSEREAVVRHLAEPVLAAS